MRELQEQNKSSKFIKHYNLAKAEWYFLCCGCGCCCCRQPHITIITIIIRLYGINYFYIKIFIQEPIRLRVMCVCREAGQWLVSAHIVR